MLTLFLCGDVMTGRGIDQVLAHPSAPQLYEDFVLDARDYVRLAERVHGPIVRPVTPGYLWGDALAEIERRAPDLRLVNLETAVTTSDTAMAGKGIHYRMHPANIACLTAARIDCAVLANNHVLDWGLQGLLDTLAALHAAGIRTAGAGRNAGEAAAPAVFETRAGRVRVFAFGSASAGVPRNWQAGTGRAGVAVLPDISESTRRAIVAQTAAQMAAGRARRDFDIVSLHWGANWGHTIGSDERAFAHALIDACGAALVHGHSSHHAKAFEVYRGRLILYGCGDFINDYEGIEGIEGQGTFRGDLAPAWFVRCDGNRLAGLQIVPFVSHRFRLQRAPAADVEWQRATLNRESRGFGTELALRGGALTLELNTDLEMRR
jgi:poly-gamma-glutamate synthesis protein (capsule biosynthesis protein)